VVTPSGIENSPNVTGKRSQTGEATGGAVLERPAVTFDCNECNEALDASRKQIATARRLALLADNAIVNGDLLRARTALRDLYDAVTASAVCTRIRDSACPSRPGRSPGP
jgi:hypothetical protein